MGYADLFFSRWVGGRKIKETRQEQGFLGDKSRNLLGGLKQGSHWWGHKVSEDPEMGFQKITGIAKNNIQ